MSSSDLLCEGCFLTPLDTKSSATHAMMQKLPKSPDLEQPTEDSNEPLKNLNQKGVKDDSNKLRYDLLPFKAIKGLVKVLTFGAKKYTVNGWKTVPNAKQRYLAALLRHISSIELGEKIDPESGLRHIDHVLTNAAFLSELGDE